MLDLCDHGDPRKWTQQHLDAADLRIACIAPTPPQGEIENDCMDVNVRGPGMYIKEDLCIFFTLKTPVWALSNHTSLPPRWFHATDDCLLQRRRPGDW